MKCNKKTFLIFAIFLCLSSLSLFCTSNNVPIIGLKNVIADTYTKNFTFLSDTQDFVGNSTNTVLVHSTSTGNPVGSLSSSLSGNFKVETSDWTWSGTWEDLGVPTGSTVTHIRLDSGYTQVTKYSRVDSVSIGPYKLQSSDGNDQATLWAGRNPTAVDSSWQAINQQSDQSVPSALQNSASSIKLYLERFIDLANGSGTGATFYEDELNFVVTYTPAAAVSISLDTNGSVSFGAVVSGETKDNTASGVNDVEVVRVDSGPANLDIRSTNFFDGINTWTLSGASGDNQVKWEFSKDGINWSTFLSEGVLYSLDTNVPQGSTRDLFFRITVPMSTNSYLVHSSTVTIVASSP